MPVKDHRELRVYQSAFKHAASIHQLTKSFPSDKKYSLVDQVRRSSRSICTNLAEAWRKRRYPNHFVSKISDAEGEAAETITWLDFSLEFGYLPKETHAELIKTYDHICAQLSLMSESPEKWVPKSLSSPSKQRVS